MDAIEIPEKSLELAELLGEFDPEANEERTDQFLVCVRAGMPLATVVKSPIYDPCVASYDRLWERLTERHGKQGGTRAMLSLLRLGPEFGYAQLAAAVEQALDLGCADVAAIRHLLLSDQLQHAVPEPIEIGTLAAYERPLPTMMEYDRLFSGAMQAVQA